MSSYNGRRPVNVTAYLNTLNTIPSSEEFLDAAATYNPADDLALWTDSTFFDFDIGEQITQPPSGDEKSPSVTTIDPRLKDDPNFDGFLNDLQSYDPPFDYGSEFTGFAEPPPPPPSQQPATVPAVTVSVPLSPAPTTSAATPRNGKRKATDPATPSDLAESSRLAAEEDKRRRNTAASARFRIKKKQKEQQLEKTAREMTDRVATLEQRIQTLEMENKWLKNLIVEKNGGKSGEEFMIPSASKDGVTGAAIAAATTTASAASAKVEPTGFQE